MKIMCPICGSDDVEIVTVAGTEVLVCHSCGYDESEALETPLERDGKKGRGVYRTGGGKRSAVKKNG